MPLLLLDVVSVVVEASDELGLLFLLVGCVLDLAWRDLLDNVSRSWSARLIMIGGTGQWSSFDLGNGWESKLQLPIESAVAWAQILSVISTLF